MAEKAEKQEKVEMWEDVMEQEKVMILEENAKWRKGEKMEVEWCENVDVRVDEYTEKWQAILKLLEVIRLEGMDREMRGQDVDWEAIQRPRKRMKCLR